MLSLILFTLAFVGGPLWAQDLDADFNAPAVVVPTPDEPVVGTGEREPAAINQVTPVKKRHYTGGADEEDLRVQPNLPEASLRVDARGLQREVYKQLYNQDLKEEQQNDMEE